MSLPADATIGQLIGNGSLNKPEDWLRITLQNMSKCRVLHGNCSMQIGVTGKGSWPSHKITYIDTAGNSQLFGAFDGQNPFTGLEIHDGATWSTVAMSFAEVQQEIGKLRGFKPKGSAHA